MSNHVTCTDCAGTGRPVKAVGSGFSRDYNSVCSTCRGTGYILVSDLKSQYNTRSTSSSSSGGCLVLIVALGVGASASIVGVIKLLL